MAFSFQVEHGWMHGCLFKVKETLPERVENQGTIPTHTVVKVVMVSRFGDCGVTVNIAAENGYSHRCEPWELEKIDGEYYPTISAPPDDFLKGEFAKMYLKQTVPWDHSVMEKPND